MSLPGASSLPTDSEHPPPSSPPTSPAAATIAAAAAAAASAGVVDVRMLAASSASKQTEEECDDCVDDVEGTTENMGPTPPVSPSVGMGGPPASAELLAIHRQRQCWDLPWVLISRRREVLHPA
ncbi:hypothetical protein ACSSS7_001661 [Eimeria intestinalis]